MILFQKNRKHSLEQHIKIGISNKGKKRSDVVKKKMRLARINYIKSCFGQISPTYNRISCEYFDWLNKWSGWSGQYATNGGEYYIENLGYWLDYYEPTQNVVVEWDEPHHYNVNGNLKEKDVKRMNEIKQHLNCKFFRYNEKTKELKKW